MNLMQYLQMLIDFILHMDKYLTQIVQWAGYWTYLILFLVIFIETGVVIMPFLPGDSLLFAAGALTAAAENTVLNVFFLWLLMAAAAILGDTVNYWIGHYVGPRVFTSDSRWFKREYLLRTQAFYDKYGGKTIFLARFIPIIRTFAPFVAGIGEMRYSYFLTYNVLGGLVWTAIFVFGGYFFGNLPFVQENFSLVVIMIILISVAPAVYEIIKARRERKAILQAETAKPSGEPLA